jgi:hypothetical protein
MAQILGPEAYIYQKDLGDIYRNIEGIKGARQRREMASAQQAGQMAAYGTDDPAAMYQQQAERQLYDTGIKAYDMLDGMAKDHFKETGNLDEANEILRQGHAESPEIQRIFAEAPQIEKMAGKYSYQSAVLKDEMTNPKDGAKFPALAPVTLVYDETTQEIVDILPGGKQFKPADPSGAEAKDAELRRKVFENAYRNAFKIIGADKKQLDAWMIEVDETGDVKGLDEKQRKRLDEEVEEYIRMTGGDDMWETIKRNKKRMKRAQTDEDIPDELRTAEELEKKGLVAPAGTKTTQAPEKKTTAGQWKDYVTTK